MSKNQLSQNEQPETAAATPSIPKCRNCLSNKSTAQNLAAQNNLTVSVNTTSASGSATSINQDESAVASTPIEPTASSSNTSNCSTNCSCCVVNQPQAACEIAVNSTSTANPNFSQLGSIIAKNKVNLYNLTQFDLEQLASFANSLVILFLSFISIIKPIIYSFLNSEPTYMYHRALGWFIFE